MIRKLLFATSLFFSMSSLLAITEHEVTGKVVAYGQAMYEAARIVVHGRATGEVSVKDLAKKVMAATNTQELLQAAGKEAIEPETVLTIAQMYAQEQNDTEVAETLAYIVAEDLSKSIFERYETPLKTVAAVAGLTALTYGLGRYFSFFGPLWGGR